MMTASTNDHLISTVRAALATGDAASIESAIRAVAADDIAVYFHDRLVAEGATAATVGLPASPGAASGRIVLTSDEALMAGDAGESVILVRSETTPDDVLGMHAARGILTVRGGLASHAAVVARGWGIAAVVGASGVQIDGDTVTIGEVALRAGDEITIDGGSGEVYVGGLATAAGEAPAELDVLLGWADAVAAGHVQVRVNADTAADARVGRAHGAQGIGLCRTEHMFLAPDRLALMRRFILSGDDVVERSALADLEVAQAHDFELILEAMDELPVTVRLLDPPLHEFLPDLVELTARHARDELDAAGLVEFEAARGLHETNPMIGTRGVRLGVVRAGLYEMQVRALCTAAANLFARGRRPRVEVMIPLVVDARELEIARSWVTGVLDDIGHPELASDIVTVGAMIETPRAALTAAALAEHADFFSFGTNDLTQMTFAFSRDDVEARLLPAYRAHGILTENPFAVLDREGVGALVRIAAESARSVRPGIKLGACGEHAGHPASARFLVALGLDSLSCSPFRIPMTRLAAAQALLETGRVRIDDIDFARVAFDDVAQDSADVDPSSAVLGGAAGDDEEGREAVDEAIVLHVLRLRGFVTSEGFVASLGRRPSVLLDRLVADGLVRYMEARDMYGLLPPGKERHGELVDTLLHDSARAAMAEAYDRFLEVNTAFKELCTDWQMRGDEPNDHADVGYDRSCVERLLSLHADTAPIIESLAASVPRMDRYAARLRVAAAAVESGDSKQFTGVMCESFHDIWMELHEDLIVLQRIDRAAEGSF